MSYGWRQLHGYYFTKEGAQTAKQSRQRGDVSRFPPELRPKYRLRQFTAKRRTLLSGPGSTDRYIEAGTKFWVLEENRD